VSYQQALAEVVSQNVTAIEDELASAQAAWERTSSEAARLEDRIVFLKYLLEISRDAGYQAPAATEMTLHKAMVAVLRDTPVHKMKAGDRATSRACQLATGSLATNFASAA